MSLDFFYDATELMLQSEHPFVIICTPKGTEKSHIAIGNDVLVVPAVADKVMQSMDTVYEQLYEEFDISEEFDITEDEDDNDDY